MRDETEGTWFARYVSSYRDYARRRGFAEPLDDWRFFRRAFIEVWAEPGFHRFWRTWNPGISYFVFRLYLRLGGARRRTSATLAAFVACGVAHNLITLPWFQRWSWTLPVAFLFFGATTLLSRRLDPLLRQPAWPVWANVALNVFLVIAGFDLGFRVEALA